MYRTRVGFALNAASLWQVALGFESLLGAFREKEPFMTDLDKWCSCGISGGVYKWELYSWLVCSAQAGQSERFWERVLPGAGRVPRPPMIHTVKDDGRLLWIPFEGGIIYLVSAGEVGKRYGEYCYGGGWTSLASPFWICQGHQKQSVAWKLSCPHQLRDQ